MLFRSPEQLQELESKSEFDLLIIGGGIVGSAALKMAASSGLSSILLEPITQDSCAFYDDHVLFDDFTGVVLETDEGDRIAEALGDKRAAILKNHGLLTTGESVDAALWAFLSMDRCCQSQLLAEAAGQMERIQDDVAKLTKTQVGTEMAMWASFQPLYDLMLEKDDSFLN